MKTGKRQKTDSGHEADFKLVAAFAEALRGQYYARGTIRRYRQCLNKAARFYHARRQRLDAFERKHVPMILKYRPRQARTGFPQGMMRQTLRLWLEFRGKHLTPVSPAPWQHWLDHYEAFLKEGRGLQQDRCSTHLRYARRFLLRVAGHKTLDWRSVDPRVIFRYAMMLRKHGLGLRGLNNELSSLRGFLRFAHMRGACSEALAASVPRFSERGHVTRGTDATEQELRVFLNSFNPRTPLMARDYAMALCMLDLGLRRIEVARLRLADINWKSMTLSVPPAKCGRGRVLPMPARVVSALRDWLRVRPASGNDACFVRVTHLAGRPVASSTVHNAMACASRRCALQRYGTHWLRHSFVMRLLRRGTDLKQIADLLGHRRLETTAIYTHANTRDLEALVRPWPQ